jgi:hypothetical protein
MLEQNQRCNSGNSRSARVFSWGLVHLSPLWVQYRLAAISESHENYQEGIVTMSRFLSSQVSEMAHTLHHDLGCFPDEKLPRRAAHPTRGAADSIVYSQSTGVDFPVPLHILSPVLFVAVRANCTVYCTRGTARIRAFDRCTSASLTDKRCKQS